MNRKTTDGFYAILICHWGQYIDEWCNVISINKVASDKSTWTITYVSEDTDKVTCMTITPTADDELIVEYHNKISDAPTSGLETRIENLRDSEDYSVSTY